MGAEVRQRARWRSGTLLVAALWFLTLLDIGRAEPPEDDSGQNVTEDEQIAEEQRLLNNTQGLCIYQDKHNNLLRAGFDSCKLCTAGCLKWSECAKVFYDGIHMSRPDLYRFDCVSHTLRVLRIQPAGKLLLASASGGLQLPGALPLMDAVRDQNYFTLLERELPGRPLARLPGGELQDARGTMPLYPCLPGLLPGSMAERERRACSGHVGYSWDGGSNCYINAGGRSCVVPLDEEALFVVSNPLLEWFGMDAPEEQLVVLTELYPSRTAAGGLTLAAPIRRGLCRARYPDGVYIGELSFGGELGGGATGGAGGPRHGRRVCYVHHRSSDEAETVYEVLGMRTHAAPAVGGCCAECNGQVNQTFPSSTNLWNGTHLLATDAGACCAVCRAIPGCSAFVYHADGSNQCWLKAHVLKKHANVAFDARVCAEQAPYAETVGGVMQASLSATTDGCIHASDISANKRYHAPSGGLMSTMFAKSASDCCRYCKQQLKCKTFSYHKVWQSCRLHFATTEAYSHLEYVSGKVRGK